MEGEKRKRKIEKEEESEEQQMEKFFALLKSAKDVRDRLYKEKEEEKAKGVWKPTFQPEDFMDDVLHQPSGPSGKDSTVVEKESAEAAPTPLPQNGNKKKPSDDDLDLTLSL